MVQGKDPKEVASELCEELAKKIGMEFGYIQITLSEGFTVKIEAWPHVQVCCMQRKAKDWTTAAVSHLDVNQAPEFVTQYLEPLIVALAGRFGFLEADIEDGRVTQLLIGSSFRSRRNRLSRRPPPPGSPFRR